MFCLYLDRWEKAQGLLREAVTLLRNLGAPRETAYALYYRGHATHVYGVEGESAYYREALVLFRESGDRRGVAFCLRGLGGIKRNRGDMRASMRLHQESLAICRELGNQADTATSLRLTGFDAWTLGSYEESKQLGQQALALYRELDDQEGIIHALENLGCAALGLREYVEARRVWQQALALSRERGSAFWSANLLHDLAELANVLGNYSEGMKLSQKAVADGRRIGSPRYMGLACRVLGEAACGLGDLGRSRTSFHQALVATRAAGETVRFPFILVGVAGLLAAEGETVRAVELLALVIHQRSTWQWVRDRAIALSAGLEAELPPDTVATAQARGRDRDLEATVTALLTELGRATNGDASSSRGSEAWQKGTE
jgi:tetratricopeptide (TPR) repeat protein